MRDVDDLDKAEFERLTNDLLLAELGGQGRFVPFPTATGRHDRGYDAAYDGPFDGVVAHWTVSAKHISATNTRARLAALRQALQIDLNRHRDRVWLVVTNVSVPPDHEHRSWLAERAPGSTIIGGEHVDLLVRKHRWVGRWHGLQGGHGLLRPCAEIEPTPPVGREDERAAIRGHLERRARLVVVRSPLGTDAENVAAALAEDLVRHPVGLPPVWVKARLPEELVALVEARDELTGVGPHAVIVPPSVVALRIEQIFANADAHTIIAFLSPSQAGALPSSPQPVMVDLGPLTMETSREWVRAMYPETREEWQRAVAEVCGGSVEAIAAVGDLASGMARLSDGVIRALGSVLDTSDRADALAWLLLLLPAGDAEVDVVASRVGLHSNVVRTIAGSALDEQLLRRDGDLFVEQSRVLTAAAVRHVVADDSARRFQVGADALDGAMRWTAALRLARFTVVDHPLLTRLAEQAAIVRTAAFTDVQSALRQVDEAALISPALAQRTWLLVDAGIERLRDGDPFAGTAWSTGDHHAQQMASDVGHLVVATSRWDELVDGAVTRLSALARAIPKLDLEALGGDLAAPLHPSSAHVRRAVDRIAAEARAAPEIGGRMLIGAAERLLGDGVRFIVTDESTLSWGMRSWHEDNPDVPALRETLVEGLLAATRESDLREASWAALAAMWEQTGPIRVPDVPDDLPTLASRVLDEVERAVSDDRRWEDRAPAEHVLVAYVHRRLVPPARAARVLRTFSADPEYVAWRWMARPQDLVVEPERAASALEAGGWSALVDEFVTFLPDRATAARKLAEAVSSKVRTTVDLGRFLHRVSAGRTRPNDGAAVDLLRAWVDVDPELFRGVVLGAEWRVVPSGMRATVLYAARPRFGDDLSRVLEGPAIDGERLGAALHLSTLLHRPDRVDASDVGALLPSLLSLVSVTNRAAVLFRVATHPDPAARAEVVCQFVDWVKHADPLDPRDAVAIVDGFASALRAREDDHPDPAVQALTGLHWWIFPSGDADDPHVLREELAAAIGWAVLRDVELGASGHHHAGRFVDAAASRDRARWLAVMATLVDAGRASHARRLVPHEADLVAALARHALGSGRFDRWAIVLDGRWHRATPHLPDLAAVALKVGLLPACGKALAAASAEEVDSETWRGVLDGFLAQATPELVGALSQEVASHAIESGALAWQERSNAAAGAVARFYRRVVEQIDAIVAHRQQAEVPPHAE